MSPEPPNPKTLYFAYGSNLSLSQMATRCPSSPYLGLARLPAHTWLINSRGYANIVSAPPPDSHHPSGSAGDEEAEDAVWGLVYDLTPEDEVKLDRNEGVPTAYTKAYLPADFWKCESKTPAKVDVEGPQTSKGVRMLVYIDRTRTTPSTPKAEYVLRMNRGIDDALQLGVPRAYIEGVIWRYIPARTEGQDKARLEELARRQAAGFQDEVLGVDGRV